MKKKRKKKEERRKKRMELAFAIPFVFLGGLYVASNANTGKKKTENFSNNLSKINKLSTSDPADIGYVAHNDSTAQNYPVDNHPLDHSVETYTNSNRATDTYFNQSEYQKRQTQGDPVGNQIQEIFSLTGKYVDKTDFEHNNMVPFYGAKMKGQLYNANTAQTVLDNMNGTGSQMIQKVEQAPLFKPEDSVQWAYGAPNMSDFYQSRVNPAMRNNNIKPFETENVGPGLNQGYGTSGSGGFNSGMESRESWLPKRVDELRVETNPKLEYSLENHEGPAQSRVNNIGILGKMEKYNPDTFFIQTQDRWLTTVGQEKRETLRPLQELHETHRSINTAPYSGNAGSDKTGSYTPSKYEPAKKLELLNQEIPEIPNSVGRAPHSDQNHKNCYITHTNKRSSVQQQPVYGGFGGAVGAVISPIMDIFKPSRKEEYVNNIRVFGNPANNDKNIYVTNPNERLAPTIKETTVYNTMNFGNQDSGGLGGYTVAVQQPVGNQRESTNYETFGNIGGTAATMMGDMNYEAAYRQTNNETKEILAASRINPGNSSLLNTNVNICISKQECDIVNLRAPAPMMPMKSVPTENYGKQKAPYTDTQSINCERMQPEILNAFRANPYTQSLSSY